MNLKKIAQWLAIAALVGALVAFVAFKEAAIKIDGQTLTIEDFLDRELHIETGE